MKYYIYKLECQGYTNHVIADENGPAYTCKSIRGDEIHMDKNHGNELSHLRLTGLGWDKFLFQGRIYQQLHALSQAMNITLYSLESSLIRWRLWLEPWPPDLVEFVGGVALPHLKFCRGNLANDNDCGNQEDPRDPRYLLEDPRYPLS